MLTSETLPYINQKKTAKPNTRAKSMMNYQVAAVRQSVTSYKQQRNSNKDIQISSAAPHSPAHKTTISQTLGESNKTPMAKSLNRPLFLAGIDPMKSFQKDPTILESKPYFSVYS